MLNVRIGQLTFGDFHPTRSAALPAAHKAEEPDPTTAGFCRNPLSIMITTQSPKGVNGMALDYLSNQVSPKPKLYSTEWALKPFT